MKKISKFALCLIIFSTASIVAIAQNLKPEEIVAKHLEAFGKKADRDALKSVMALGASEFESNVPVVKGGGKAVVVSNPDNLFFVISLNSREYPFEKIGYFAGKANLPFITAGNRSMLGAFLSDHSIMLSEGLFGGATSMRWPLWDLEKKKPKLGGGGTKKVNDRKAYVINYDPSSGGSSEFTIKLYFDAETFNHIRTEYRYEVQPTEARFGQQNQRASGVAVLIENFSDFRSVDGFMLPHYFRAELSNNGNSGMYKNIWGVKVAEYRLNQALAADFFTFDPK
ncbi:MAG: hypothetical protein ABL999_18895 [Pyrinomonadaceae bacterium]